jgi:hypothetical protein
MEGEVRWEMGGRRESAAGMGAVGVLVVGLVVENVVVVYKTAKAIVQGVEWRNAGVLREAEKQRRLRRRFPRLHPRGSILGNKYIGDRGRNGCRPWDPNRRERLLAEPNETWLAERPFDRKGNEGVGLGR